MIQGNPDISFSISYQYQQSRLGNQIFSTISKDFDTPSWIQKVYQKEYQNSKEGIPFKLQVLDTRKIKQTTLNQWVFLDHDLKQDERILNVCNNRIDTKIEDENLSEALRKQKFAFKLKRLKKEQYLQHYQSFLQKNKQQLHIYQNMEQTIPSLQKYYQKQAAKLKILKQMHQRFTSDFPEISQKLDLKLIQHIIQLKKNQSDKNKMNRDIENQFKKFIELNQNDLIRNKISKYYENLQKIQAIQHKFELSPQISQYKQLIERQFKDQHQKQFIKKIISQLLNKKQYNELSQQYEKRQKANISLLQEIIRAKRYKQIQQQLQKRYDSKVRIQLLFKENIEKYLKPGQYYLLKEFVKRKNMKKIQINKKIQQRFEKILYNKPTFQKKRIKSIEQNLTSIGFQSNKLNPLLTKMDFINERANRSILLKLNQLLQIQSQRKFNINQLKISKNSTEQRFKQFLQPKQQISFQRLLEENNQQLMQQIYLQKWHEQFCNKEMKQKDKPNYQEHLDKLKKKSTYQLKKQLKQIRLSNLQQILKEFISQGQLYELQECLQQEEKKIEKIDKQIQQKWKKYLSQQQFLIYKTSSQLIQYTNSIINKETEPLLKELIKMEIYCFLDINKPDMFQGKFNIQQFLLLKLNSKVRRTQSMEQKQKQQRLRIGQQKIDVSPNICKILADCYLFYQFKGQYSSLKQSSIRQLVQHKLYQSPYFPFYQEYLSEQETIRKKDIYAKLLQLQYIYTNNVQYSADLKAQQQIDSSKIQEQIKILIRQSREQNQLKMQKKLSYLLNKQDKVFNNLNKETILAYLKQLQQYRKSNQAKQQQIAKCTYYQIYLYTHLWKLGLQNLNKIRNQKFSSDIKAQAEVIFFLKILQNQIIPYFIIKYNSIQKLNQQVIKNDQQYVDQIICEAKKIKQQKSINLQGIQNQKAYNYDLKIKQYKQEIQKLKIMIKSLDQKSYKQNVKGIEDNQLKADINDRFLFNQATQYIKHQYLKQKKKQQGEQLKEWESQSSHKKQEISQQQQIYQSIYEYQISQLKKQYSEKFEEEWKSQSSQKKHSQNKLLNQNKIQNIYEKLRLHNKQEYIFNLSTQQYKKYKIIFQKKQRQLNQNQTKKRQILGIQDNIGIQLLFINIIIKDICPIFGKLNKKITLQHMSIDDNIPRNLYSCVKKIRKMRQMQRIECKHFKLAFQGGGTKGFSYVGAYRAIKQQKILDGKPIPIKSILGSSAGGIVAIATSTGIHPTQIEAICYKMKKIPLVDRISSQQQSFDQYENRISIQSLQKNLKALLKQYGIVSGALFDELVKIFKSQTFRNEIEQKLVHYLQIANPDISQIFSELKSSTRYERPWHFFGTKKQIHQIKTCFNWNGLFLHGALMKGEFINTIAAQFLVKYFFKQINASSIKAFGIRLLDAFIQGGRVVSPAKQSLKIISCIKEMKSNATRILQSRINQFGLVDKTHKFLVYLINAIIFKAHVIIPQIYRNAPQSQWSLKQLKFQQLQNYLNFQKLIQKKQYLLTKIVTLIGKGIDKIKNNLKQIQSLKRQIQLIIGRGIPDQRLTNYVFTQELLVRNIEQEINFMILLEKFIDHVYQRGNFMQYFKIISVEHDIQKLFDSETNQIQLKEFENKLNHLMKCTEYLDFKAITGKYPMFDASQITYKANDKTIKDFIFDLFGHVGITQVKQAILKRFQVQKIIYQYFEEQRLEMNGDLLSYHKRHKSLIEMAKQITTKQYFCLNRVQLTFTSVDLDDKILRLFNHKTTPNLPICKAVQMTGSFPVAFKAQRWQKKWGSYRIQRSNYVDIKEISGHQFTDGGLLANFPMKYFDNQQILKQYFQYAHVEGRSIMLGFGLDHIQQQQSDKSNDQLKEQNLKSIKLNLIKQQIASLFTKQISFVGAFLSTGYFGDSDQVRLGQIDRTIADTIPVIRFISKILSGYPNAERQFNIQAFQHRLIHHKMLDINDLQTNKFIIYDTNKYNQQQNEETKWKLIECYRKWKKFKNVIKVEVHQERGRDFFPQQQLKNKIRQQNRTLITLFTDRVQLLKNGYLKIYSKPFINKMQRQIYAQQIEMSKYLLNILLITLRDFTQDKDAKSNQNRLVNAAMSQRYKYYKHIVRRQQPEKHITIRQKLNQQNFTNLFNNFNVKEISHHLDFKNFEEDFISYCQKSKINLNSTAIQAQSNLIKQYGQKMKDRLKKKQGFFTNPQQYYVNDNLDRLTKYLYIQIKSEYYKNYNNTQKILQIIKLKSGDQLLKPQSQQFQYLKFDQILQYMYDLSNIGINYQGKMIKIKYQKQFQSYLNNAHHFSPQQRISESFIKYFKFLCMNFDGEIIQNIQQMFNFPSVVQYSTNQIRIDHINKKKILKKSISSQTEALLSDFWKFIMQKWEFTTKRNISSQSESNIINIRNCALQTFKKLLYGSNYQLKHFQDDFLRLLKNNIKDLQNINYQINLQQIQCFYQHIGQSKRIKKYCCIQKQILLMFYQKTITHYIDFKVSLDSTDLIDLEVQNRSIKRIIKFHSIYLQDTFYIIRFLNIIAISIVNLEESENSQIINTLFQTSKGIHQDFLEKYKRFAELAVNQINQQSLNDVFLIKFKYMKKIVNTLKQLQNLDNSSINQTVIRFLQRDISIPFFKAQMSILHKSYNLKIESQVDRNLGLINVQFSDPKLRAFRNFIETINNQTQNSVDLHLLLQSSGNCSDYYSAFYDLLPLFLSNSQKIKTARIKVITCTGYHSMFGFLLSLGKNFQQIRQDMLRISQYSNEKFNKNKIKKYFNKQGIYRSEQNFSSISQTLKGQISTIFERFTEKVKHHRQKFNYQKEFNQIRILIEEQQQYFTQTCNNILDDTIGRINKIQGEFIPSEHPRQIAKAFAINYFCSFQQRSKCHKYHEQQLTLKQDYLTIMNKFYSQFGQLLSALFCDSLATHSSLIIQPHQIQQFTKGALIKRMQTIYKLKTYIYEQLVNYGLPRNITLNELHERSPLKDKIILNFTVINVSEKRIQMFNKIQTPKMPVWAAILASSSLPIVHRDFWCERQWQQLNECPKYHEIKQVNFFGEASFLNREKTFYNTSMYVSSLPIEIFTNQTINNKIISYYKSRQDAITSPYIIGIAFNTNYSGNLAHHKVNRQSINITVKLLSWIIRKKYIDPIKENILYSCKDAHFNKDYEHKYGFLSTFKCGISETSIIKMFKILADSNDNFIMKWYYDKLIKLPVKCNTLQFNKFIDQQQSAKYKLNIPSKIAQDTKLRSYQITKSFIHNISSRFSLKREYYSSQMANHKRIKNRYKLMIRAEMIKVMEKASGYQKDYFKLLLVNHTKWNKNLYNSFVVEYMILQGSKFGQGYIRAQDSEILWLAQSSKKIKLRIYHLKAKYFLEENDEEYFYDSKNTKIKYRDFILDFTGLYEKSLYRISYDYVFQFARYLQNQLENEGAISCQLKPQAIKKIVDFENQSVPFLKINIVQNNDNQADNKKQYIAYPYVQRSRYKFKLSQ